MTLASFDAVRAVLDDYFQHPAVLLVGNSVWQRLEELELIALFDSLEMAEAYELAARLPARRPPTAEDSRMRTYREDSLLHGFNLGTANHQPGLSPMGMFVPAPPWMVLDHLPRNPAPCTVAPSAIGQGAGEDEGTPHG